MSVLRDECEKLGTVEDIAGVGVLTIGGETALMLPMVEVPGINDEGKPILARYFFLDDETTQTLVNQVVQSWPKRVRAALAREDSLR